MGLKDKLNKINPKYKTLSLAFVPVVMAAAFFYFVYLPDSQEISTLEATIAQNESEISKSKVMERKLGELKAANARLQEELKAATKFLPGRGEDAKLQDTVAGLAQESGLAVKAWTPGAGTPDPSGLYIQTVVNVEVAGGYHELGKFMEKIDGMARMLNVSNLTMSSAKLEGRKMSIATKFTLTAYSAAGGK